MNSNRNLIMLQDKLWETLNRIHDKEVLSEDDIKKVDSEMKVVKQMINNADVILRSDKLINAPDAPKYERLQSILGAN